MGQSSSHNGKDFDLKLTKEWVKQGRYFTSILESSEKYGKLSVYWKLSGDGITKKDLEDGKLKGTDNGSSFSPTGRYYLSGYIYPV